jgi:hypothetical protein
LEEASVQAEQVATGADGVEEKPAVEEKPSQARAKAPEIIAEKFYAESSINENLASARDSKLESKLIGQPIDSISRNIGINDRFLIIRELFEGDAERFKKLLEALDNAGNLQAAKELLDQHFSGSPEHDGISILASLVKRKYNKS